MFPPVQVYMVFGLFTFLGAFLSYIWPALWIASCFTTRVGIHVGVNSVSGGDLVHSQVMYFTLAHSSGWRIRLPRRSDRTTASSFLDYSQSGILSIAEQPSFSAVVLRVSY